LRSFHQSLAREKEGAPYSSRTVWRVRAAFKTFHSEVAAAWATPERNPVAVAPEELHQKKYRTLLL